jgi:hypothetical protein
VRARQSRGDVERFFAQHDLGRLPAFEDETLTERADSPSATMQGLTLPESRAWLAQRGFTAAEGERSVARLTTGNAALWPVPTAARGQRVLSWILGRWLRGPELLLLHCSWAVFTDEEMAYFTAFRQAEGIVESLFERPGQLYLGGDERTRARLVEAVSVLFALNWEGYVCDADGTELVWLADEVVEVNAAPHRLRELKRELATVYLDPLWET